MVSARDSRSCRLGSSLGREHCIVFLGKTGRESSFEIQLPSDPVHFIFQLPHPTPLLKILPAQWAHNKEQESILGFEINPYFQRIVLLILQC